jgi:DNA-binding XRE family transcriptional regulator
MKINWLWDARLSEARVKKILEDENNPRFYIYAEKLFSRVSDARTAFSYIPKEAFYRHWPVIKRRIDKDAWGGGKAGVWQKMYDQTAAQLNVSGSVLSERMGLAQQIKGVRLQLGYTQSEMAKKLGVIQQFISKLETGRENLTVDSLKNIADVLGKKLTIRLG